MLLGSWHAVDVVEHPRAEAILTTCASSLVLPQEARDERLVCRPFDVRHPYHLALEGLERA